MNLLDKGTLKLSDLNREVPYTFLDSGYMLLVEDIIDFGAELIEAAEKLNKYTEATLSNGPSNTYKDNSHRSSKNLFIHPSTDASLEVFKKKLEISLHICTNLYMYKNRFVSVKKDTGYELLKYDIGCEFKEHVDIIPGHEEWSQRKLSAVAFLNDSYTGGELEFKHQQLKLKPKAGSILIFASGFTYPHSSLPVQTGTKFSLVSWFI